MRSNDFQTRLRQLREAALVTTTLPVQELAQWAHYWNDEESDMGNLRNLHHWLERAQQRVKPNSLTRRAQ